MSFLQKPTHHLFFTGKGGVGKTSVACATALELVQRGHKVLLVSTDPASNLDEMLNVPLSSHPTPVPDVPGLSALNINPEEAAEAYRQRVLGPMAETSTPQAVATMREQLSGACTTEIAAFDAFAGLLASDVMADSEAAPFDHVLFDTAPTGHTLRLLQLTGAWSQFLTHNSRGASCLGPHSALKTRQDRFAAAFEALQDPQRTTLVLVARPEKTALAEAARTAEELQNLGVTGQELVLNGCFVPQDATDPVAHARFEREAEALRQLPPVLQGMEQVKVPLQPFNMVGVEALRRLWKLEGESRQPEGSTAASSFALDAAQAGASERLPSLATLVDALATEDHGLILVMGKGGVGKTTLAAAVAVALAKRGLQVQLTTTDPAAHVAQTVAGSVPGLEVSRIDPQAETRAYVQKVIESRRPHLDAEGLALLEEDLRSPCTEEVAVFHAFSRVVASARRGLVVLDTAPTGHSLLLLDATGAYHRQVFRDFKGEGGKLITPLMRLKDPHFTRVLLVTLAETTPVSEAAALQADLRRAGIEPFAWVINSSLVGTQTHDPLLLQRSQLERTQITRVQHLHAQRVAVVPWQVQPPVGPERLMALSQA